MTRSPRDDDATMRTRNDDGASTYVAANAGHRPIKRQPVVPARVRHRPTRPVSAPIPPDAPVDEDALPVDRAPEEDRTSPAARPFAIEDPAPRQVRHTADLPASNARSNGPLDFSTQHRAGPDAEGRGAAPVPGAGLDPDRPEVSSDAPAGPLRACPSNPPRQKTASGTRR